MGIERRIGRLAMTGGALVATLACAGCRGPTRTAGAPVVLADAADREPETIAPEVFREGFSAIRQMLIERHYDEAMTAIEDLARHDLPSTLARALGQLRSRCLHERFLARHPLSLEVEGPAGRGRWLEHLDLVFVVHNEGAEAIWVEAEDGSLWSWLGLASAARSLLRFTVVQRTGDGRGLVQEKRTRFDHWLEDDLEMPPGGAARIPYRLDVDTPEAAVWCRLELRAVLMPLGLEAAGGESIYLPLEFPQRDLELFRDEEIGVLADPVGAIGAALDAGAPRRLFCAVMALDETDVRTGIDLLLARLGRSAPAIRRAGLAALRARTGHTYGQDLESWRGWWLSKGRDASGR